MGQSFKRLTQCKLTAGTSRMVAYIPSGSAYVGSRSEIKGVAWEVAQTYLSDSSQYIAWYIPFGAQQIINA